MTSPLELYHLMPTPMVGQQLVPLARLHEISSECAAAQQAKYKGREDICERRIPHLDCRWNEVLQLSPVHPEQLRDAIGAAGHPWRPCHWLAVDPVRAGMTSNNAVIWRYPPRLPDGRGFFGEDCEPFTLTALAELTDLPGATRDYYRSYAAHGRFPLLFVNVPHVFFRGVIDLAGCQVLEI